MRGWQSWWRSYRYRFVPWLARGGRSPDPHFRRLAAGDSDLPTARLAGFDTEAQLQGHLCDQLARYLRCLRDSNHQGNECLGRLFGFSLRVAPSSLFGGAAGLGVFVATGRAPAGALVGLYPGTIYSPGDPALLPSLGNRFILRRADGLLVDAGDSALGRAVFRSCAGRDRLVGCATGADAWLGVRRGTTASGGEAPSNVLATGHIVNNETADHPANVRYREIAWSTNSPTGLSMAASLPCAFYSAEACRRWLLAAGRVPLVALVSCRGIEAGEELLSAYVSLASG